MAKVLDQQAGPQQFENLQPSLTVWEIEPGITKSVCFRPRHNLPAKILINGVGPTPQQEPEELFPEYIQGSVAQMAKNGHQYLIIKMGTTTFLMQLQLCKEEDLARLDQLPGLQLYGNDRKYASLNPGQLTSQMQ